MRIDWSRDGWQVFSDTGEKLLVIAGPIEIYARCRLALDAETQHGWLEIPNGEIIRNDSGAVVREGK